MHYDGFKPPTWSGLKNWTYVFSDYPLFWPALRNTLWLVVVMVTLRVALRPRHRPADHQDQDGRGRLPHRCSTCPTWPRRSPPPWPSSSCSTPAPARSTPSSASSGCRGPGWFNDPTWSKPALTLLALWGIGDLMVIFMAALLDVPKEQYEAAELDGAGAWQRFRYVTLPNISPIVMFAVVTGVIQTMQYYTQPLVAGKVASRRHRRLGPAVRARLPGQVDPDPAPARLQPRLPALRLRLRVRRRAGAVRAVDGRSPRS